jgi:hypothetical protein
VFVLAMGAFEHMVSAVIEVEIYEEVLSAVVAEEVLSHSQNPRLKIREGGFY